MAEERKFENNSEGSTRWEVSFLACTWRVEVLQGRPQWWSSGQSSQLRHPGISYTVCLLYTVAHTNADLGLFSVPSKMLVLLLFDNDWSAA